MFCTSPAENLANLISQERVDLYKPSNDLDPYPLVGTSIIYAAEIRIHASKFEWEPWIFKDLFNTLYTLQESWDLSHRDCR